MNIQPTHLLSLQQRPHPAWQHPPVVVDDDGRPRQPVPSLLDVAHGARHQHEVSPAHLHRDLSTPVLDVCYGTIKTYLLDFLCPTSKNMSFKWNGVVVLGYPVIESLLHLWVVGVNVG